MALAMAGAAAIQMVAAYKSAQTVKQSGRYAQKMYNWQAQIEEQNALEAERTGNYESRQKIREIDHLLATQRNLTGAAGMTQESTLPVRMKTASEGAMDAAMIQRNWDGRAQLHRQQASILRWQGKTEMMLARRQARAIILSGMANAVSMGGGTYSMYRQGGWTGGSPPQVQTRQTVSRINLGSSTRNFPESSFRLK